MALYSSCKCRFRKPNLLPVLIFLAKIRHESWRRGNQIQYIKISSGANFNKQFLDIWARF